MSEIPAANQPETISKAEFDKINVQNAELAKNLESMKGQLLDTEYLNYLADKKAKGNAPAQQTIPNNGNVAVGTLTLAQLQQFINTQLGQGFQEVMKPVYGKLNEIGARQELDDVRSKYADFGDYQQKVVAILEGVPNTELSIEQAYLIAKANAANEAEAAANEQTPPAEKSSGNGGNEKPGGTVPLAGESAQRHKDSASAAAAAWQEVRTRHGLTGDTI